MISTPTLPTLTDAKLLDNALQEIQTHLTASLSWLDSAFGKAQNLTDTDNNNYPAIYTGEKGYINLLPDDHLGNYTYFDIEDGQEVDDLGRNITNIKTEAGLVVWFDFRDIYPGDWKLRTIENVKSDVITVLQKTGFKKASFRISRIWEEANNIYKGYDHNEINNQFLMRPYGGFRVDLELIYYNKTKC